MLIAVAGFAGVGKTTAVTQLEAGGFGRQIYVGDYINREVRRRGLPLTPQNERLVRHEMREQFGRDVFARMVAQSLAGASPGENVLLDAIYVAEEAECYRRLLPQQLTIVGLEAAFDIRAQRLASRPDRRLSSLELRVRDAYESEVLKISEVVTSADIRIVNDGTLAEFTSELERLGRILSGAT